MTIPEDEREWLTRFEFSTFLERSKERPHFWVLNDDWEPVPVHDVLEWAKFFESSHRVLAHDRMESYEGNPEGAIFVSTVFLGIDHSFGFGPPILWETMVFKGVLDGEQDRYHTKEEALRGHQRMCERVNASLEKR